MLEQAITEWREAALAEGRARGYAEGRAEERAQNVARECASLNRFAAWRFGSEAGEALGALIANEDGSDRLDRVSELLVDCANGDELLRRTRAVLAHHDRP